MPSIVQKKVFASLPRTERGKPVRITGDPKHGVNFLYCNGNSVFIRNLKDPVNVDIYTEHSKPTTVARYSPSGFYIASGDVSGKIRIWDTVNPEHILKAEYPVLGGKICELAWCPESKKIAACGDGREKHAHVFNMDTGTSAGGGIAGHTKQINTISYRCQRPFRVVTASEDMTVKFFEGPPFKFSKSQHKHTNFVNVARYSTNGSVVVSGGADGKLIKYDGQTLDEEKELDAHKRGIYEVCFGPGDEEILTVSGDKTAKIFNVGTGEVVQTFDMSSQSSKEDWHDMLLGGLWQKDEIIVVNGLGHIIYLDRENKNPKRVIKGHMKPITSLALSEDKTIAYSGGQEGIVHWDVESGDNDTISGQGHNNEITDMVISGDSLYSVGVDDTLRVTSVSAKEFSGTQIKLDSQPKAIDCKNGKVVVACENHLIVFEECGAKGKGDSVLQKKVGLAPTPSSVSTHPDGASVAVEFQEKARMGLAPTSSSVGIHPDGTSVAVGLQEKAKVGLAPTSSSVSIHPDGTSVAVGFQEKLVIIYSLPALEEQNRISVTQTVNCLAYSPDGTCLAFNDHQKVIVVSAENYKAVVGESAKHTARVLCMAWSPDGRRFATSALDKIRVWPADMTTESEKLEIKGHTMSHANKLAWLNSNSIITVGQDSNIKQFEIIDEQSMQQQVKH